MRITVRLAEPFWRHAGRRDLDLELAADARVADLLALLGGQYPALKKELAETQLHIFVGDSMADQVTRLAEGDCVHLVWPIGGG